MKSFVYGLIAAAVFAVAIAPAVAATPVMSQDDIVVGFSENATTFGYSNDGGANWTMPTWTSPSLLEYVQGIEFDNSNNTMHNASGNMLGSNFGNAYTGFSIYNVSTNGNDAWETTWSIKEQTGGAVTTRGGGLSVSPDNTKVAWFTNDGVSYPGANGSQIMVLDYNAGSSIGTGAGSSAGGPRVTGDVGAGLTAGKTGSTQGTTWLDNNTVLAFNGFGEMVTWDISAVAPGTDWDGSNPMVPTVDAGWQIVNSEVSFTAQYTDVLYNAAFDPDHIYASVTRSNYASTLFLYDYDTATGDIELNKSLELHPTISNQETREIGMDSAGNLFWSSYAGSGSNLIVGKLAGASDPANWTAGNVSAVYVDPFYTGYNGLDVASSISMGSPLIPGDCDNDGDVDLTDLAILASNYGAIEPPALEHGDGDFDNDGDVDLTDLAILANNWGFGAMTAVPEPATMSLLALGGVAVLRRRK